jgi:hypothetical protein
MATLMGFEPAFPPRVKAVIRYEEHTVFVNVAVGSERCFRN